MTKQEIRKENLKRRAQFTCRKEWDSAICRQFLSSDIYKNAKTVMTYISYKSEPDTHALLRKMSADGKTVCAPVCKEHGKMESYAFSDISELTLSEMGILEPPAKKKISPEDIDLILVPGCAFNSNGYRLGYGGGYYDRYLPRTRAVTCGFFYEALKTEFLPESTDVPLHYIITEKTQYCFM